MATDYTVEETIGINRAKLKQVAGSEKVNFGGEKQHLIEQLEFYKKQLDDLILLEIEGEDVSRKYKEISSKLRNIQDKLQEFSTIKKIENIELDIEEINIGEFSEALVKKLINKVKIISKEEIEIEFVSAVKIKKSLN